MKRSILGVVAIIACMGALSISRVSATPYCSTCPYTCSELGLGRKDCSEIDGSRGSCCVDLTQRGMDVARAFDRARDQGQGGHNNGNNYDRNERCPAGFQPSEQKCSPDERRRGCKDIRLPNGLGCVRR
jgi:hypothetical protein